MKKCVAFALCGSFCTFEKALGAAQRLLDDGWTLLPVMSANAAGMDTRFGTAASFRERLTRMTGQPPVTTIAGAEPLGPQALAEALIIAPCTGNTLAKLALGITDTPVTMAAKSLLRIGRPVLIALSTNDGLAASMQNIGRLLNTKNVYFVPFGQDDPLHKPAGLQSDFSQLEAGLLCALRKEQLQPVLTQAGKGTDAAAPDAAARTV